MAMAHPARKSRDDWKQAFEDYGERVARNDPDWGLYFPGDPRPVRTWWQRLFFIPPK
ncbi:MAG TPA: hypothetical protein VFG86_12470 [Chloroflexota bacterium]|nr:hypothetical protein [Chloroflexota bacterium]